MVNPVWSKATCGETTASDAVALRSCASDLPIGQFHGWVASTHMAACVSSISTTIIHVMTVRRP